MNDEEEIILKSRHHPLLLCSRCGFFGGWYWILLVSLFILIRTSSSVFSIYEFLNNGNNIQIRRRLDNNNNNNHDNNVTNIGRRGRLSLFSSSASSSNLFSCFLTPEACNHPKLHFQDTHPEKFDIIGSTRVNGNNKKNGRHNHHDTNKVGKFGGGGGGGKNNANIHFVTSPPEVVVNTPTDEPTNAPTNAYCGDGIVQVENGEDCDDGTGYKKHDFQYTLENGGKYSPCTADCKWKNTMPIDCIHGITEALWIDIYIVTDSFEENWFELKQDSQSIWNPSIDGKIATDFNPTDPTLFSSQEQSSRSEFARKDTGYHFSECMSPDYCWEFDFLDISTLHNQTIPVFDTKTSNFFNTATNYWAKLTVLTNGILDFSDQDYMSDGVMSGFKWGNCSQY